MSSLAPRQLVDLGTVENPMYCQVWSAEDTDTITADSDITADGWRIVELPRTGYRYFGRVTDEVTYLAAWDTYVARVELRTVADTVRDIDGRPSVCATVGAWVRRNARARVDQLD